MFQSNWFQLGSGCSIRCERPTLNMDKDVCAVGAEVPMNAKYLSEDFEDDFPTQPVVKETASRILFLPKGILMLLIVLLACVTCHASKTFAEEQAVMSAGTGRTAVQEMSIAGTPKDQARRKKVLVLHTLKVRRPWNLLFNRYFMEALEQSSLPPHEFGICLEI